jgi:hypothetical protein
MTNVRRVSVIMQGRKLVGVYVPPDAPADPRAPAARIVAGPRQKLVELEILVPQSLKRPKEIAAFHALVQKQLKRPGARRK